MTNPPQSHFGEQEPYGHRADPTSQPYPGGPPDVGDQQPHAGTPATEQPFTAHQPHAGHPTTYGASPHASGAGRRRFPLVIAGAVVGLVVGGGIVAGAWLLSGSDDDPAAQDAAAACAILDRFEPAETLREDDAGLVALHRWGAAGELATAAAEADDRYRDLGTALRSSRDANSQTFDPEHEDVTGHIAEAHRLCDDL